MNQPKYSDSPSLPQGLVALSFDDGRIDNYTVALEILNRYNLPATFNLTTGYIKGEFQKGRLTYAEPLTLEMVKELFALQNHEIAGHGYWHKNTKEDILQGISELCEILGTDTLYHGGNGFASPGTDLDLQYYEKIKPELAEHNVKYVRLSLRYGIKRKWKVLARKVSRLLHIPALYAYAYTDTLMSDARNGLIYSVPVLAQISVAELKALIRKAAKQKKACVLMFHSIIDAKEIRDNWDYPTQKFQQLCMFLDEMQSKNLINVVTSMTLFNALKID